MANRSRHHWPPITALLYRLGIGYFGGLTAESAGGNRVLAWVESIILSVSWSGFDAMLNCELFVSRLAILCRELNDSRQFL